MLPTLCHSSFQQFIFGGHIDPTGKEVTCLVYKAGTAESGFKLRSLGGVGVADNGKQSFYVVTKGPETQLLGFEAVWVASRSVEIGHLVQQVS